jgi:hypothetical protein
MVVGRLVARVGGFVRRFPAAGSLLIGPLPYLAALRHLSQKAPPATLVCVYRRRNLKNVLQLVAEAEKTGMQVRLWALDDLAPELAQLTLGSGPGTRFQLLNKLASADEPSRWLVIVDDDVRFLSPRPLGTLLKVSAAQSVDISQPAQARGSFRSHLISRQGLLTSLRETTFVDQGPVVAFSPRARSLALPFPEEGMGWGVELEWLALRDKGVRLGLVDCVPLLHLLPMGGGYDMREELARLDERLHAHGFATVEETQKTVNVRRFA